MRDGFRKERVPTAKKPWRKTEARVAEKLGGTRVPLSGAGPEKGDVRLRELLIDTKTTAKASLSIKVEWLSKLTEEAMAVRRIPALAISFECAPMAGLEADWVMLPASALKRLIDRQI